MVLLMIRISFQEVYQGVISGAVLISDLFMMGGLCVNTFKFISWLHPNVCLKTNTPSPHACTHTHSHTQLRAYSDWPASQNLNYLLSNTFIHTKQNKNNRIYKEKSLSCLGVLLLLKIALAEEMACVQFKKIKRIRVFHTTTHSLCPVLASYTMQ